MNEDWISIEKDGYPDFRLHGFHLGKQLGVKNIKNEQLSVLKQDYDAQRMAAIDNKDWFDALKVDYDALKQENLESKARIAELEAIFAINLSDYQNNLIGADFALNNIAIGIYHVVV